jgi:MerR family mercuric resistance operon transcriptional regulator
MERKMLTRGKLATETGCNIETIRYYEAIGLMPAPERTAAGYRSYNEEHLRRLNFIQRARALGFTSDRIQGLLELTDDDGCHTRADVKSLTEAHIEDIEEKIRDLQKIKRRLRERECRQLPDPRVAVRRQRAQPISYPVPAATRARRRRRAAFTD